MKYSDFLNMFFAFICRCNNRGRIGRHLLRDNNSGFVIRHLSSHSIGHLVQERGVPEVQAEVF